MHFYKRTAENAGRHSPQVIIPTRKPPTPVRQELPAGSPTMLTHAQIWMAIDRLAARSKLSASGLAKRAGLDPTTFNKSKRITADGRARWPSTESIAKSLAATGATLEQFVALISDETRPGGDAVPLISFADAGAVGRFDDNGFPS